jgi:hypothetical protein
MAVFKITIQISKLIAYAMVSFWWGDMDERKMMHCVRGGGCMFQRKMVGWVFRDLRAFNLAMLAK